jgi:hypothetical protein
MRRRPVRRILATVGAVIASAAVVSCDSGGAGPEPVPSRSTAPPTPVPGAARLAADLRWDFRVAPLPGYQVTRQRILSGRYQLAEITSHGGHHQVGFLRIYDRGVHPLEAARHVLVDPQPVRVSGRPGRFAVPNFGAVLVWKYAPESYATVVVSFHLKPHKSPPTSHSATAVRDRRIALRIARATKIGPVDRLGIDFALGYLPSGLRYENVEYEVDSERGLPSFYITFVDSVPGAVPDSDQALSVGTGSPPDGPLIPAKSVRVNGQPARLAAGYLQVSYPHYFDLEINVDRRHLTRYPRSELVRIAQAATLVGDPARPSTWADAHDALPH